MIIREWAFEFGIPFAAVLELERRMGLAGTNAAAELPGDDPIVSEKGAQSAIELEAPRKNCHLFRNNVGALLDARGVPVRYGLANKTKQQNKRIKSADLVGWRSFVIEPRHVGRLIAQFLCREIKEPGWHYTGDAHEQAQLRWAELVISAGGDAGFATGVGTL